MATENRKMKKILMRDLNCCLTCTLCGGYFIDATTLVDCLHTFCRGCILRYFENNKLGCPTCNSVYKKKSYSYFRPDPQIQSLVYKLVPGLYSKEMQRREDFYRSTGARASSSCSDDSVVGDMLEEHEEWVSLYADDRGNQFYSPEDPISLSLEYYQHHLDVTRETPVPSGTTFSTNQVKKEDLVDNKVSSDCSNSSSSNNNNIKISANTSETVLVQTKNNGQNVAKVGEDSDKSNDDLVKCEMIVKKEEKDDGDCRRFLRCPAAVSMSHLQKFVRMKYALTSDHRVDIIYDGEVLPVHFSLMDVAYTFNWNRKKPLRFFYRIFTPMKIRPIKIINTSGSGGKQLQIVPVKPNDAKQESAKNEAEIQKERHFAQLELQSKAKAQQNLQKKTEPQPTCIYEYEEPDKEEIKKFAEKRDREWAMQKHLDEQKEIIVHRVSKKRKKNKHSKNESEHKKRKLHAEITSNEVLTKEESLKLKVKLTPHNGHKHKHHRSSQSQNNASVGDSTKTVELSSKEKLLQMRAVRHKHVSNEEKGVQATPMLEKPIVERRHSLTYEKSPQNDGTKSMKAKNEVVAVKIEPNISSNIGTSTSTNIGSNTNTNISKNSSTNSSTNSGINTSTITSTNININTSTNSGINTGTKTGINTITTKTSTSASTKTGVNTSTKSGANPKTVSGSATSTNTNSCNTNTGSTNTCTDTNAKSSDSTKSPIKTNCSKDLVAKMVNATVQIERNEQTEKQAQKTFLKTFPSNPDRASKAKERPKAENAKVMSPQNPYVALGKSTNALHRTLERKIASLQLASLHQQQPQQRVIERKDQEGAKQEKKVTFSSEKPQIMSSSYHSGFTVSKVETGTKRKVEVDETKQDKRPSLEITLINPTPPPPPTATPSTKILPVKRPPPATIPLDRIKKSIILNKSGISIIPKMPEKCDNNPAPLDLSKPSRSADLIAKTNEFGKANGLNMAAGPKPTTPQTPAADKNVNMSNLQMLSKVAIAHQNLNQKPRPQMPALQTLKIPVPQSNNSPSTSKPNLPKMPELNEINKLRMSAQMRNMRQNQNKSVRYIPNPSWLVGQQNQNRLNSISGGTNQTTTPPTDGAGKEVKAPQNGGNGGSSNGNGNGNSNVGSVGSVSVSVSGAAATKDQEKEKTVAAESPPKENTTIEVGAATKAE